MKPTVYQPMTWPIKKSVIAKPRRIRTRCCFTQILRRPGRRAGPSVLVEELHLDARDLDQVVVFERVGRRTDRLAIYSRALRTFHVSDEVALRTAGENRDLHAGLAERGEGLGELELLAGVAAR